MSVDYRLRRYWYRKQGQFVPEDVEAAKNMLAVFRQRDGESDEEFRRRLDQQSLEFAAEADRWEAEHEADGTK